MWKVEVDSKGTCHPMCLRAVSVCELLGDVVLQSHNQCVVVHFLLFIRFWTVGSCGRLFESKSMLMNMRKLLTDCGFLSE